MRALGLEVYELLSVLSKMLGNGWVRSVDSGRWNSGFSFSGDFDVIAVIVRKLNSVIPLQRQTT